MSVYFCNKEAIDLAVIRVMGVNVKKNENAIGYFGTGLKFAIATLLRNGQSIQLIRDGQTHLITAETQKIRGEEFEMVTLDGQALSFTTDLGRNWEVWMAYRELHSNCLDENGVVSDLRPEGEFGTVFKIDGELFDQAYAIRDTIFLSTEPEHKTAEMEMHPASSQYAFYRGIRVLDMPKPSLYTYNMLMQATLTEDRSLAGMWSFDACVARLITQLTDVTLLERLLLAPRDSYEGGLTYQNMPNVSDAFLYVCSEHRASAYLNESAGNLWRKRQKSAVLYRSVDLNSMQERDLNRAFELLKTLDCTLQRDEFVLVEGLGGSCFGLYREGEILIDRKALDKGPRFLAGTLYEEWLHKTQRLPDESQELQNVLLDRLMFFVEMANLSVKP